MKLPALLAVLLAGLSGLAAAPGPAAGVPVAAPVPGPSHHQLAVSYAGLSSGVEELVVAIDHGAVVGAGAGQRGQLTGAHEDHPTMTALSGLPAGATPDEVAVLANRATVVLADGLLYGTGENDGSLSPNQGVLDTLTPLPLPSGLVPAHVYNGWTCSYVVGTDGVAYRRGEPGFTHGCGIAPGATSTDLTPVPNIPAGREVVDVAAGGQDPNTTFSVLVLDDGSVWGSGRGAEGQLVGTADRPDVAALPALPGGAHAVAAAAGDYFTVVLTADGRVFGTGSNACGQLTGTDVTSTTWRELTWAGTHRPAVSLAANGCSTLVIDDLGAVHATGAGVPVGQSGVSAHTLTPLRVPAGFPAADEVLGAHSGVVVHAVDGTTWGWGVNYHQRFTGDADRYDELRPLSRALRALAPTQILDSAVVGRSLTAVPGSYLPVPTTVSVAWLRDGSPVPGATGPVYDVQKADAGHRLSVRTTSSVPGYPPSVAVSAPVSVAPRLFWKVRPHVSGRATVGRVLRASLGSWCVAPTGVRYQWVRDGKPVRGANRPALRLKRRDAGHRLAVRLVLTRAGFPTEVVTTVRTAKVRR